MYWRVWRSLWREGGAAVTPHWVLNRIESPGIKMKAAVSNQGSTERPPSDYEENKKISLSASLIYKFSSFLFN